MRLGLLAGLQAAALLGTRQLLQVLSVLVLAWLFTLAYEHRHWGGAPSA